MDLHKLESVASGVGDDVLQVLFAQLELLERKAEEYAVYRHDLSNHLICLKGLLRCKDYSGAEAYLDQLTDLLPKIQTSQYHTRTSLNVLCAQKAAVAQSKAIEMQVNLQADCMLEQLSDYALCTLLGNLLDNGIEHADGEEPYIYLDLYEDDAGNTVLRMENSCMEPPVLQHGVFVSCKADKAMHGKGMEQIRQATEQTGGVFSWVYDQEHQRFITQCVFVGK